MVQSKSFKAYMTTAHNLRIEHKASKRKDGLASRLLGPRGTNCNAFKFTLALVTISIFCPCKINFIAKHEQHIQCISQAYQIITFILNETLKIPHKANLLCNYLFLTTED